MKILVTGASGLIGSELLPGLTAAGHTVIKLVRASPKDSSEVQWTTEKGILDPKTIEGIEAAVHLAGENIAGGRWTDAVKARIRDSRRKGTFALSRSLAELSEPPKVLVSGSAIGFYGDRGHELLTESSAPGAGFLPMVCKEWEAATEPASARGIRVVHLRTGVVLSAKGGALARMLLPFKMGVGGKIGSGNQYMSWIHIAELVRVVGECLNNASFSGPVNGVAPNPVTNSEFTKILGSVLGRPTIFPVPAVAARLAFGEMADALLLASTRVQPQRLRDSGYRFTYETLEPALRDLLG